ncbi:MAG: bifunctional UDP-sugar hydrolase/5'-nucleotidase, partial [bacterium]
DSGDIYQGSVYYQLFDGMPEMNFLDIAGYDAICVGNHELDKGVETFENLTKLTKTPFLGANLEFKHNFYLNGKIKSQITKDYEGYRVGIIGMTTPEFKHISAYSDEIELRDYEKTLQFLVDYIRNDVDFLVLLSHSGAEKDIETAKNTYGIDVIVGGHSHTFMEKAFCVNKQGRKTLVVQAGEFGVKLGRLDIDFDEDGINKYSYKLIPLDENVPSDPQTEKKVAKLNSDVNLIKTQKTGTINVDLDLRKESLNKSLTNSGALVLQAIAKTSPTADISMINSGSIRGNKILPKGKISKMEIIEMLPFSNKIVLLELKGSDIKSILENSARRFPSKNEAFLQTKGISYTIDFKGEPQILSADLEKVTKEGNRIKNVKINDKELDENATYKVLTTDYLFSGGDGYLQFKRFLNSSRMDYSVTNAVIDYIQAEKRVSPKCSDKLIIEE